MTELKVEGDGMGPNTLCVIVVHGAPEAASATRVIVGERSDTALVATSTVGAIVADLALANVGYGTAANAGFHTSARPFHEWFVVLNDDIVVTRQSWDEALSILSALPATTGLWSFSGFSACIHPPRPGRLGERPPHGAALAIRADLFRRISGFDAKFFLYAEEVDLWLRLPADVESGAIVLESIRHDGAVSSGGRFAAGFELGRSTALLARTHRYWMRALARTMASTVWVGLRRGRPLRALSFLGGFVLASAFPDNERVATRSYGAAPRAVRERYRLALSD